MTFINKLQNSTVGILGLGYIGSNLYSFISSKKEELNINVIPFDKGSIEDIKKYNFDYFINCAGFSGDFRSNLLETVDANISLVVYLLKNLKIERTFLSISSTRIYGFASDPTIVFDESYFRESSHLSLDYIYDGSKKMMETMLVNYSPYLDYNISIVRLSNVYGKYNRLDDSTLIKKIIKSKINNCSLTVNQNRYSNKDYIYIDDAVDGIMRALLLSRGTEIYNVAFGQSYSIADIANILDMEVHFDDNNTSPSYSNISIRKAIESLNYSPVNIFNVAIRKY